MKILAIGDIVGSAGCNFLTKNLASIKAEHKIDLVIANGENSAEGNGILPSSANQIFDSGVQVITTGNHALRRREVYDLFEQNIGLIRPANFHPSAPGMGWYCYERGPLQVAVVNLQGQVFLDPNRSPFDTADEILQQIETLHVKIIVVDFHAEATAEKLALAYYLDGRVSAVYGTHTHVQTADERILPQGTGYLSDLGMCGVYDSILGMKPELSIKRLRTHLPVRFENASGSVLMNGTVFEIDNLSGKCTKIYRVNIN